MADLVKASYDLVNHFLGEPNRTGQKRVPEKYDELVKAIAELAVHAYHSGQRNKLQEAFETVDAFAKAMEPSGPYPQYKPSFETKKEE